MKKIISILLIFALIATLCLSLISCEGDEDETENKIIVGGSEDDENETVKKPTETDETQDWGLGEVPLH